MFHEVATSGVRLSLWDVGLMDDRTSSLLPDILPQAERFLVGIASVLLICVVTG